MTGHILICCAVIVFYAGLRFLFPTASCPRCLGKRVTRHGARASKCQLCQGHGRVVWPGATAVHRFFWSVLGHRLMEHHREAIRARQAGGEN